MIDVVFPQKPLRKWQPRAGQDGSFQPTFVGFHIAFAVLFTTETRVVWDPVLGQGMARLDVDDELKGVDGWCVVRGWLFQHRIVFVSFCLTPVGPWCFSFQFDVTQCIHFQIDSVFEYYIICVLILLRVRMCILHILICRDITWIHEVLNFLHGGYEGRLIDLWGW